MQKNIWDAIKELDHFQTNGEADFRYTTKNTKVGAQNQNEM
jgi:hypothetical protein